MDSVSLQRRKRRLCQNELEMGVRFLEARRALNSRILNGGGNTDYKLRISKVRQQEVKK